MLATNSISFHFSESAFIFFILKHSFTRYKILGWQFLLFCFSFTLWICCHIAFLSPLFLMRNSLLILLGGSVVHHESFLPYCFQDFLFSVAFSILTMCSNKSLYFNELFEFTDFASNFGCFKPLHLWFFLSVLFFIYSAVGTETFNDAPEFCETVHIYWLIFLFIRLHNPHWSIFKFSDGF